MVIAQTMVLLAGVGHTPESWHAQQESAPPGWTVLTPWLRGTAPGAGKGSFDIDSASEAVAELIRKQPGARASVGGLSLGAMVALHLAARNPELVERLVICAAQVRASRVLLALQTVAMRLVPKSQFRESGFSKEQFMRVLIAAGRVDLTDDLPQVSAPTLVLCGSRDFVNLKASRQIASTIPRADMVRLRGGHLLNTENPTEFSDQLWSFVAHPHP